VLKDQTTVEGQSSRLTGESHLQVIPIARNQRQRSGTALGLFLENHMVWRHTGAVELPVGAPVQTDSFGLQQECEAVESGMNVKISG